MESFCSLWSFFQCFILIFNFKIMINWSFEELNSKKKNCFSKRSLLRKKKICFHKEFLKLYENSKLSRIFLIHYDHLKIFDALKRACRFCCLNQSWGVNFSILNCSFQLKRNFKHPYSWISPSFKSKGFGIVENVKTLYFWKIAFE